MQKILTLIIMLLSATAMHAFYYNDLYFYPTSDGGCVLRGFDPNSQIPSTLTLDIPTYAYDRNSGNTYKVTSIGQDAFKGCVEIEHLVVPASVEEIGPRAFRSCINLKECILYPSTKVIGQEAFFGCLSLTTVNTSAESIGIHAFKGCTSLVMVNLGSPMKYIEPGAFMDCTLLPYIDIPITVERIGSGIGYLVHDGVFENCLNLSAVTFVYNLSDKLSDLKKISDNTFKNCTSLTRLDLPYSVTQIGYNAFLRCASLKHLEWGGPKQLSVASNDLTGVALTRIVCHGNISFSYPEDTEKLIHLDELRYDTYATEVQSRAFMNNPSLRKVHLDKVVQINSAAFKNCPSLVEATLSPELESIGFDAFYGCSSLQSIHIPANVSIIGNKAFYGCSSLRTMTLEENLETIESAAFQGCSSLSELTVPMSVRRFTLTALNDCINLKSLTVGGPEKITIGDFSYDATPAPIETITMRGIVQCGTGALKSVRSARFTDYCDHILPQTFYGCKDLCDADFSNIRVIDYNSFMNCTALTSANLSNVETIENYAFDGCTALGSVTLGSKISRLNDCFSKTGIKSLYVPGNITAMESPRYCPNLTEVTIGNGITRLTGAFYGCDALTKVRLGDNFEYVGLVPSSIRTIISGNPVPPSAAEFSSDVYQSCELIVPVGAGEAYRNAPVWKKFHRITESDNAGVDSPATDTEAIELKIREGRIELVTPCDAAIYTLDGLTVESVAKGTHSISLAPGAYIIKAGKTTCKFIL